VDNSTLILYTIIKDMKNHRKFVILAIIILFFVLIGYFFLKNKTEHKKTREQIAAGKIIPPTLSWERFMTDFGFSFMHEKNLKVETKKTSLTVGDLVVKIEKLDCKDGRPSKDFAHPITIYGYKTILDEENKFAYICNNTNTACLDIYSKKEDETTEGFFHAFISTLEINDNFNKISCR